MAACRPCSRRCTRTRCVCTRSTSWTQSTRTRSRGTPVSTHGSSNFHLWCLERRGETECTVVGRRRISPRSRTCGPGTTAPPPCTRRARPSSRAPGSPLGRARSTTRARASGAPPADTWCETLSTRVTRAQGPHASSPSCSASYWSGVGELVEGPSGNHAHTAACALGGGSEPSGLWAVPQRGVASYYVLDIHQTRKYVRYSSSATPL